MVSRDDALTSGVGLLFPPGKYSLRLTSEWDRPRTHRMAFSKDLDYVLSHTIGRNPSSEQNMRSERRLLADQAQQDVPATNALVPEVARLTVRSDERSLSSLRKSLHHVTVPKTTGSQMLPRRSRAQAEKGAATYGRLR